MLPRLRAEGPQAPALTEACPDRTADPKAMLVALRATGATQWEALALAAQALGEAALRPRWEAWATRVNRPDTFLKAMDEVAKVAPGLAQAWLYAWLGGRTIEGDLDLGNRSWVSALPAGLTVRGGLRLDGATVSVLPAALTVGDWFNAEGLPLTALPEDLRVGSHLALAKTKIEVLPDRLRFLRGLDLEGAPITALPDGLTLELYLNLCNTPIVALPKGLRVGSILDLRACTRWDGQIEPDTQVDQFVFTDAHSHGVPLAEWRERHPRGERP
jgi:hypothetical protein